MYDSAYYEELRPSVGLARWVDEVRDGLVARVVRRRVPGGRLLDVGCGRGDLLARFDGSYELHGIELSDAGLELARGRLPDADLRSGDIQVSIPFEGPFDVITAINVIEHLVDPASALRNFGQLQDPGALLVVHLPTIGSVGQRRRYEGSYAKDPTHVYRPSGDELVRLVEPVGYDCLRRAYAPFIPFWAWANIKWQPAFLAVFRRT